MKKIILGLTTLLLTVSAMAQKEEKNEKREWKSERREMQNGNSEKRKDNLEKLNLSEDQKQRMKAINEEFKKEMEELKAQKFSEEVMREKRKAIINSRREKISSILTPEQRKQWEEMMDDRKDKVKADIKDKRSENLETIIKSLNLTADQNAKFESMQAAFKTKWREIKSNTSLTEEQRKSELKELFKNHRKSIESILTEEQKKLWKEKIKEQREDRKGD